MSEPLDLAIVRRFFAEELEAVCGFRSPGLVDAFATIPREKFLPAGPWQVLSVADYTPMAVPPARATPDADPRRVYHNIGIAIDPGRRLFNGHPGTLASWIDALALTPGARVLHIGAGLGYYTAIIAHAVGSSGRVVAIEVDEALAAGARANLASMRWVDVRHSDGTERHEQPFDAILVNAGVTHPRDEWLDALAPGGRMMLPLTATMPQMGPIGKGFMLLVTHEPEGGFAVKPFTIVAIYSALDLRDETMNAALGQAMMKQPFPPVKRLRRDTHEPSSSCWLHGATWCLSLG
jgi:protein-L-isoaspartate(D-aspartate) O-methyltransferase